MRDNLRLYGEMFALYNAREKGLPSEDGGYFDQPNVYNELMSICDSAMGAVHDEKERIRERKEKMVESLKQMGFNATSS